MRPFKKIISVISITIFSSNIALAKPNNPPECDPRSPDFLAAAENSVVIVVPKASFPDLGHVLAGCENAKAIQISEGIASHNCVVIRSEDFSIAKKAISNSNVQVQGIISHFDILNSEDIAPISNQIKGSVILNTQPWDDKILGDPQMLNRFGHSGYNKLRAPLQ